MQPVSRSLFPPQIITRAARPWHSGQLNIANSAALGSGTLTMSGGNFDNTSGGSMTLANNIRQAWNSNFTYVGSASNLNLGSGAVTLGGNITATVNAELCSSAAGSKAPSA